MGGDATACPERHRPLGLIKVLESIVATGMNDGYLRW